MMKHNKMIKKGKIRPITVIGYNLLTVLSVLSVVPFLLMIMSSLSSEQSITANGYLLFPSEFSLEAYRYLWNNASVIGRAYVVTVGMSVTGTLLGVLMTLLLAYALSRPSLPGRKLLNFYVIFTMLFNGGLVSTYLIYTEVFHIKNTLFALLVPSLLMNAFNVMLARNFFEFNVPASLIEAAKIDGASEFQVFWKIVFPVSKPIIATIAMFVFMAYWNDWNNGLYYLTDTRLYNIQNVLNDMLKNIQFLKNSSDIASELMSAMGNIPSASVRMAIASAVAVPVLIIFPFFESFFVKGIVMGGIKE